MFKKIITLFIIYIFFCNQLSAKIIYYQLKNEENLRVQSETKNRLVVKMILPAGAIIQVDTDEVDNSKNYSYELDARVFDSSHGFIKGVKVISVPTEYKSDIEELNKNTLFFSKLSLRNKTKKIADNKYELKKYLPIFSDKTEEAAKVVTAISDNLERLATAVVDPYSCLDLSNSEQAHTMFNYVNDLSGYNNVLRKIGSRTNGCARFISQAFMLSGMYPKFGLKQVTSEVQEELESRGWKKTRDLSKLKSGAILFSKDSNENGIPDHVFMFHSWGNNSHSKYFVIDNQGKKILRNVYSGEPPYKGSLDFAMVSQQS